MRRRLEEEMVRRGLAASPGEARGTIVAGHVTVGGRPVHKPESLVAEGDAIVVSAPTRQFVSRGGEKLAAAFDRFGLNPSGRRCLDAGASTGGFTDVLLQRGAAHVVAVDVGYGQLAWRLRTDPRVTVMERTNVRDVRPDDLPYAPDLIVVDLSFISLAKVIPALAGLAALGADVVALVKPQFEATPEEVAPGGVVTDPHVRRRAVEAVAESCRAAGLGPIDASVSPLRGPAGNAEIFLWARKGAAGRELDLDAAMHPETRRHA